MVKFLCVSDTVMPQMESATNLRRRYYDIDAVISCGDMPPVYLEFITSVLSVPLLFVRGNHDERYESEPPGGLNLHRNIIEFRGLAIAGLEGSIRYNRGLIQYTEFEMLSMVCRLTSRTLPRSLLFGKRIDILVTHSPPFGIHDEKDPAHRGFKSLLRFLDWNKPRYMLHGHVHTYDRRKTTETKYNQTCIMNINPVTVLEVDPE
jgi:uncharacterized protein